MAENTIVRDNFVRAGSAGLGANWTEEVGAISVTEIGIQSSGVAAPDDNTGNATSFYNAKPFAASQYAEVLTGASSKIEGVCLLAVPGDTWYRCISTTIGCAIAKCIAGSYTQVASDSLGGVASGSLIRAEAVTSGTSLIINMYVNGTLRLTYTDSSPFTTGAPGLAASTTAALMGTWEGGDLIWTRRGTVIPIGSSGGTQEPSVIYEGNAKILSGNVFKMWYTNGWLSPVPVVNYAESTDGVTWSEYASNPVMANGATPVVHGSVFHFGSTYYAYYSNGSPATQLDQWTSSDGVNWTLAHAAVLSAGTTGAWDVGGPYNPWVWIEGSTWYMLYEGGNAADVYSLGLATSSNGISWTKYVSNPVITNSPGSVSGPTLYKIGDTYYVWTHTSVTSDLPTDISLWSSTDLHTWTPSSKNPIYERVLANEGGNNANGQVADAMPLEVSGMTYMYYDATPAQSAGNIHINLATVPYTMAQLVASEMGVSIISGNAGVAGATVSYTGTASGSVTADGSGNYTLNLANGTYTITPTKTSYTFSPSSTGETVASTSVTGVNFTASGSLATPTFAISDGALNLTQQVTITVDADATSTYYTTDGSTPTPASMLYSGPFNITTGETITAYSVASGYTDSAAGAVTYAQQATPTFSPVAGSYGPTQSVSITSASATEVYYEVGSSPYPSHETLYTTQVSVASSETVYARAARTGYVNSAVSSAAYTINGAQATPTFSPVAGSYGPTQSVTITSTGADAIYYTADGTSPTTGSTLYTGAVSVATSETLKALAVKAGWSNSSIGSAVYTINGAVATPTFSPVAGTYSSAQSVTVSDANSGLPGFAMYYTTNGNSPTTGSTLYTGAIPVSASETIKVLAVATGYSNSTVGSAAYVISGGVTPTVFTANGLQVINSLLVTNSLQVNNNLIPAPYTQPLNPGDE